VRVLGKCGGTIADINDGIRWAAGLPVPGVPTNTTPAKVINMSLGGAGACTLSPSTQAAINDAVGSGTAVVVAAGNEASDASGFLPASCDNVITVAASDYRGHLVTRYSNFGATVEIMAPGGDVLRDDDGDGNNDGVLSMVHPADGTYARYNGTSMATPHVAGVAALVFAQDPSLTPGQLLADLQSHALPRTSSQCPRPCGAGLLSALRGAQLTVSLVLDPDTTLQPGETATARATVTLAGAPQPGKTVAFSTGNPGVASVSPTSAVTNASGQAQAIVRGESQGNTTVTAVVDGTSASAPVQVAPVQVPDLSLIGVIVVVCTLFFGLRRTRPRSAQR
jgi:serine protease